MEFVGTIQIRFLFSGVLLFVILTLSSCAVPYPTIDQDDSVLAYTVEEGTSYTPHGPVFLVREPEDSFNRIGAPVAEPAGEEATAISISTALPTVFVERRYWQGQRGEYTNLYYRIHFPKVPVRFFPFNIGAGENVGLFVILTYNDEDQLLLVTTLHTCGCYLAFVPTSNLPETMYPHNWPSTRQIVYGENLPARLPALSADQKLVILIGESEHRVEDIWPDVQENLNFPENPLTIRPMTDLEMLQGPDEGTLSFFETEGSRTDYVVGSQKVWERLLMSWWALDWRVGEDKRLGRTTEDGPVFYTSLKPWARGKSDLRDFARFLDYWGWSL